MSPAYSQHISMAPARVPPPLTLTCNRMTWLCGSSLMGEIGAAGDAGVDGDGGVVLLVLQGAGVFHVSVGNLRGRVQVWLW